MKHLLRLVCVLLPAMPAAAAEPRLPELHLTYATQWKAITLGEIVYTLKPAGDSDCYEYRSVTNPVGMVRMFYGRPHETSEFCVRGGKIIPRRFSFVSTKSKSDDFTLEFDVAAGKVRGGRPAERELPPNGQDRFGLQQAVRLWVLRNLDKPEPGTVEFPMVDDDRIKVYRFAITGREQVDVPAGRFDAVVVERVDDPKKTIRFWLSEETDYLPVKVQRFKDGKSDLLMQLKSRGP